MGGERADQRCSRSHGAPFSKPSPRSRSEFIITDTLSANDFEPSASVLEHNLRVVICIPLRRRGAEPGGHDRDSLLGVLYLDSRQQRQIKLTSIDDLLNVMAEESASTGGERHACRKLKRRRGRCARSCRLRHRYN